jgi:hypothetical protein
MLKLVQKFLLLVLSVCACSIVFSGEPTMNNPLLSKSRPWRARFRINAMDTAVTNWRRYTTSHLKFIDLKLTLERPI